MTTTHKRILVVEDDLGLRRILKGAIRKIDPHITVDWVISAEAAEAALRNIRYDMIIADIYLKGTKDGFDFWSYCENTHPEIPFIVMSSMSIERFFRIIGSNHISPPFLAKPFKFGECLQLIEGIMRYHQEAG